MKKLTNQPNLASYNRRMLCRRNRTSSVVNDITRGIQVSLVSAWHWNNIIEMRLTKRAQCCFDIETATTIIVEVWRRVDAGEQRADWKPVCEDLGLQVLYVSLLACCWMFADVLGYAEERVFVTCTLSPPSPSSSPPSASPSPQSLFHGVYYTISHLINHPSINKEQPNLSFNHITSHSSSIQTQQQGPRGREA